jgi:RimJ/RimL family protein N-acetyltransferase
VAYGIPIKTGRFLLREICEADRTAFLACQADASFSRFHSAAEHAASLDGRVFDLFLRWRAERPRRNVQLAVATRSTPSGYLGTVGLRTEGHGPADGEIGIELVPRLWGQGAATEILRAFIPWARVELGVSRLVAETAPGNLAAERLAAAAGLRIVGEDGKRHWRGLA